MRRTIWLSWQRPWRPAPGIPTPPPRYEPGAVVSSSHARQRRPKWLRHPLERGYWLVDGWGFSIPFIRLTIVLEWFDRDEDWPRRRDR